MACKKDGDHLRQGTIVGWNDGYCIVCGGFYLNLSGDTTVNPHTYYVLNYTQSLIPVINKLSVQYHKDNSPISVYVDGKPAADSLFGLPTLFVTNIKAK
jgi:hypothetical protein